jgi:hypothetical protein
MPQPTTPKVMRSEGAGRPSRPKAEAGMKVGNAMAAPAAPVTLRKLRRLSRPGEGTRFVIEVHHGPQAARKTREKNNFFRRMVRIAPLGGIGALRRPGRLRIGTINRLPAFRAAGSLELSKKMEMRSAGRRWRFFHFLARANKVQWRKSR